MRLIPYGPNQTEIQIGEFRIFFSYQTPVACYNDVTGEYFKTEKKWSCTASRHINNWLDGVIVAERPQEFFDSLQKEF